MAIKRCYPVLVGASVAENQLCNGESVTVPNGHKYYLKKSGTESLGSSTGAAITGLTSGSDMVIDLSLLLGYTIAGYVYSLETATVGSGIAWLRSYGFLGGYVPYNAGSIESVEVTEKKCVGFNQWDGTHDANKWISDQNTGAITNTNGYNVTGFIPILPNQTYYHSATGSIRALQYDADKNPITGEWSGGSSSAGTFTAKANAYYVRFTVTDVNLDGFIANLYSDRNGEYEPYTSTTYPLGSDVLRGVFKLDANNRLYADGDRKTADGTITRYYGTRAYQEGDESLADAITDGTTTVYKLSSPTTEISTPFTSPQIVYPDGTEEFITENNVPVGHETKYQL